MRKNHDGSPIDSKDVFFADPPPEIGEVLSASTTDAPRAKTGMLVLQTIQGTAVGIGLSIFGALFGMMAAGGDRNPNWTLWLFGGGLLFFAIGAYLGAKFLVPHFCSYVGTNGLAFYARYGTIVRRKLVPFVATGDLRIKTTRMMLAGRHIGDVWEYRFIGTGGQALLKLRGPTAGSDKNPGAHVHFLRAAQVAWQAHQSQRLAA
jgi:hypothetical protein